MTTANPQGRQTPRHTDNGDQAQGNTQGAASEAKTEAKTGMSTASGFWTKFNEDWVMNFSGMLAYNYLTAIAPLLLALVAIAGFVLGSLSPATYHTFTSQVAAAMPGSVGHSLVNGALGALAKSAGVLLIISIITAIFSGSRLFVALENCFAVIYRVNNRPVVPQNVMAILMTLLFIVLAPISFFASTITGAIMRVIVPSGIQHNGFVSTAEGFVTGVIVAFLMFAAIYYVVPNFRVSWKSTWPGALFAAVLVNLFEVLFPIYQSVALKNAGYGSVAGLAIVILIFLYYIGLISLLGAEMNAWAAGLRPMGRTLPELFRDERREGVGASDAAPVAGAARTLPDPKGGLRGSLLGKDARPRVNKDQAGKQGQPMRPAH